MSAVAHRVRVRDASSWFRLFDGGRVELVVLRRDWQNGGWAEIVVAGESIAEAEDEWQAERDRRGEAAQRQAERRARWGPRELG